MDNSYVLKPALATSWDVSKDGLVYNFHLRKGVKFHNGKEMTAEDVMWSIEYAKERKNAAYGRDKVKPIKSMTAPDPYTLRVALKEPFSAFISSVSTGFDAFDDEINKYYHQAADEADSLDFDYLVKFYQGYVLSGRLIANDPETPYWVKGDKYEAAGNVLYDKVPKAPIKN